MNLDMAMFDVTTEPQKKCSNCDNYIRGYCSVTMQQATGVCDQWTPQDKE